MFGEAHPSTVIQSLAQTASRFPERGITVLADRRRASRLTYPNLLAAAEYRRRNWSALGVVPGDRVLLALPTSWDLIHSWLGALFRGALPVVVAPLQPFGDARSATAKLQALARHLGARCVVVSETLSGQFAASAADVMTAAQWERTTPHRLAEVPAQEAATAYLQLTSGTLAAPRAVEISHGAVIYNTIASYDAGRPRSGTGRLSTPWFRGCRCITTWAWPAPSCYRS